MRSHSVTHVDYVWIPSLARFSVSLGLYTRSRSSKSKPEYIRMLVWRLSIQALCCVDSCAFDRCRSSTHASWTSSAPTWPVKWSSAESLACRQRYRRHRLQLWYVVHGTCYMVSGVVVLLFVPMNDGDQHMHMKPSSTSDKMFCVWCMLYGAWRGRLALRPDGDSSHSPAPSCPEFEIVSIMTSKKC